MSPNPPLSPTSRPLGSSGIAIRPIGYGAMALSAGTSLAGLPSEKEALAVLHAAFDAGAELVDTADTYGLACGEMGHNERLVGKALRLWPGCRVTVATKGGVLHGDGSRRASGSAAAIRAACEASLQRLGLDAISLYQLHGIDRSVPLAETAGALADLRREGKILHIGLSNVYVPDIEAVRAVVPVVSVQNRCSVLDNSSLRLGIVAFCEAEGIAFIACAPVGGRRRMAEVATHPVLGEIGARHDATPFQVALAWLLAQSPAIVPIPGGRRVESVTSSAAAIELQLGADDLAALDRAFPTGSIAPAWPAATAADRSPKPFQEGDADGWRSSTEA